MIGDNFYEDGVDSVESERFKLTFEDAFKRDFPNYADMKFYVIAGNHDYYGNMTAQIEYTKKQDRWKFDSLWYKLEHIFDDFSVDILMIDTPSLHDEHSTDEVDCPDQEHCNSEVRKNEQKAWIAEQLESSVADYLIVVGHHPVFSSCEEGVTYQLVEWLYPLLVKHKVGLYLSGHKHNQEFLDDKNSDVKFAVSGTGHKPNKQDEKDRKKKGELPENINLQWFWNDRDSDGAYVHLDITKENLKLDYILADDESVQFSEQD